jgi:hypothetical protein
MNWSPPTVFLEHKLLYRGHPALHAVTVKSPICQMLAPADTAAHAVRAAHDLGDQAVKGATIGKGMPVITMIREYDVIRVIEGRGPPTFGTIPGQGRYE